MDITLNEIFGFLSEMGLSAIPLVIIIMISEFMKQLVYKKMANELFAKMLTFFTPLIIAGVVTILWLFPDVNLWEFIRKTAGHWAFAVLGFDGIKAVLTGTPVQNIIGKIFGNGGSNE